MKPTHGFKNPLIGFGERQGRVGGGVRREWGEWTAGLKEVMEQSRYQSQQTAPLLSNEQEGLVNKLAKEPPQLVMETRPTAAGASDWLSQRQGRSRASSAGKVSAPRARPRKRKKKINIVQYRCLSYFSLLQGGKKIVSSLLCVP